MRLPPTGGTPGCTLRRAGKPKIREIASESGKRLFSEFLVIRKASARMLIAKQGISALIIIETPVVLLARRIVRDSLNK
jgi:hypothetical protein